MSDRERAETSSAEWSRLALFVDGARVWMEDVEDELEEVIGRAERVEGRVYHNWDWHGGRAADDPPSRPNQNTELWGEFCERHGLERVDAPQISATGIQLTLDAIDLRDDVDALCILSVSHSLAPLCERFRAAGVYVVGLSNWRSKDEFRNACDEFVQVDDRLMSQARRHAERHREEDSEWGTRVAELCQSLRSGGNTWAPLALLETYVQEIYPEFDPEDDGCESLEQWIRERSDQFAVRDWTDRRTGEATYQVRAISQSGGSRRPPPRPAQPWEELVTRALREEPPDEDGWVLMTKLGARLKLVDPDWAPQRYGADKLLTLLDRREELFEIDEELHDDGERVRRHWVRLA